MTGIEFRLMHDNDLHAVSELAMLANPHAKEKKYRKHIFDELRENPDLSFIAVCGERIVGYVQGYIRGSYGNS